jgi:hypothetical protein
MLQDTERVGDPYPLCLFLLNIFSCTTDRRGEDTGFDSQINTRRFSAGIIHTYTRIRISLSSPSLLVS